MNITLDKTVDCYEVIVAGGGPAGCTAAVAAARQGVKVLLIESSNCLGGMGTIGMVPSFAPFTDKEKLVSRGIAEEIITEYKKRIGKKSDECNQPHRPPYFGNKRGTFGRSQYCRRKRSQP